MPKVNDRVVETTTSTGTGTVTLAGAVLGYQSFSSAFLDQDIVYYAIEAVDANGNPNGVWEAGIGTFSVSGPSLSRDQILSSSNSGNPVNLSGTSKVFCPVTAVHARRSINPNLFDTTMGGL